MNGSEFLPSKQLGMEIPRFYKKIQNKKETTNKMNSMIVYSTCLITTVACLAFVAKTSKRNRQDVITQTSVLKINRDQDKALVESLIDIHENFPKKGIVFRDVFPVLRHSEATAALFRLLGERVKQLGKIDVVLGLESRGFLIGPNLAILLNCAFAPVRKPGKLPGKLVSVSYEKEYGKDTFEMQANSISAGNRVLIVDDLLATGGSLFAAVQLVEGMQATVVECMVIIELLDLTGRKNVTAPVWSLFQF